MMLGVIAQKHCWIIRGQGSWNRAVNCVLAHKQALSSLGSSGELPSSSIGEMHAELHALLGVGSHSVGFAVASIPAGCCEEGSTSAANHVSNAEASTPVSASAHRECHQQRSLCRPVLLPLRATSPRFSANRRWRHGGGSTSAALPFRHVFNSSAAAGSCCSSYAAHMSADCLATSGISLRADRGYRKLSGARRKGSSWHRGCKTNISTDGSKQEVPGNALASGPSAIVRARKAPRMGRSSDSAFVAAITAIKMAGIRAVTAHNTQTNRHSNGWKVTAAIQACHSIQQLQELLLLVNQDINHISITAAIMKLQKLLRQFAEQQQTVLLGQTLLNQLLQLLRPKLPQCGSRELANMIYALCMMPSAIQQQQQSVIHQMLLPELELRLKEAKPQEVSNVLYGMAKAGQQPDPVLVQHLLGQLCRKRDAAKPQEISNSLWAVARLGHEVTATHWRLLLDAFMHNLDSSKFQEMQNFLHASATLGLQIDKHVMLVLLDALHGKLHEANSQGVANTLWACGQFRFYPQQLLAAPEVLAVLPAAIPVELAQVAHACGQLGHRDERLMAVLVQQAVQWVSGSKGETCSSMTLFLPRVLCGICWAIAVLDLQQHAADVLVLVQACSQQWASMAAGGFEQLHQVHTWLLDCQLAGGQGLAGTLTQQQLQQCKQAWEELTQQHVKTGVGKFQRAVFAAVRELPINWQQPPQMEQLSVTRDGEVDGAALIDITAVTADGVRLAIEVDGPWHFRQPDGALTGSTMYRNRALAARGYQVISVPFHLWDNVWGKQQQQQQCLMQLVRAAERQQQGLQPMRPAPSPARPLHRNDTSRHEVQDCKVDHQQQAGSR